MKTKYILLLTAIVIFFTLGFIDLANPNPLIDSTIASYISSFISILIAVIALHLADKKPKAFDGKLICSYTSSKDISSNNTIMAPKGEYQCLSFEINNHDATPISDLIVSFRFPSQIIHPGYTTGYNYRSVTLKNTEILSFSEVSYLGNNVGDCRISLEHYVRLTEWPKTRVLYITIAGSNVHPRTYKLNSDDFDQLIETKSLILKES